MEASVYLFGSKLNDQAKGGDIDLIIESDLKLIDKAQIKMDLESQLGLAVDIRKYSPTFGQWVGKINQI